MTKWMCAMAIVWAGSAAAQETPWQAQWIWAAAPDYLGYNQTIEARRSFELEACSAATLRITADTRYRLYINGEWVNDGPARSWPGRYIYDVIDVLPYLREGENEIHIVANFFGIGTFHQVPMEAGLLAQLDATREDGSRFTLATDAAWETRAAMGWAQYAPKRSVQMGPFELYDARRADTGEWQPAVVRYAAMDGPWKNLSPRDCPLLTRVPFAPRAVNGAHLVARNAEGLIFPTSELAYGGVTFANNHNVMTGLYATVIAVDTETTASLEADGNAVYVDGKRVKPDGFSLKPGEHLVVVALSIYFGHWRQDTKLNLQVLGPHVLRNPIDDTAASPWCYVRLPDTQFLMSDLVWSLMPQSEKEIIDRGVQEVLRAATDQCDDLSTFRDAFAGRAQPVAPELVTPNVHDLFQAREVIAPADTLKQDAAQLAGDGAGAVTIAPSDTGDLELVFDLGEQNVGYYEFTIDAEEGLVLDLFGVEYIAPDGRVQHTDRYRNGMRYICREGENTFTSRLRRSQRYIFLTLRQQTKPATLREFRLIESTYPVEPAGSFACSDERLTRIWDISARTLKLCMEDTFTDCPLYEQTLWVGDARNEALFAYTAFGAEDLARRCIKLTADSLEQYPMALCQVPTSWEIILPAWSFLWGQMVWEHYVYTGDLDYLRALYPDVIKNLRGAAKYTDARGLFSAPFWNMFDWSGIDDGHDTVLHNSMFAVSAIDAALHCAAAVGDDTEVEWLEGYRAKLVEGIEGLWDEARGVYPDSVHNDGEISTKSSVHTHFLSLLYGIAPESRHVTLVDRVLNPPADMTRVGSPFAIQYQYEALEKAGRPDAILQSIYDNYVPMLEAGATTVWESFPQGTTGSGGFPTRSHTHAWSSAPIHFLNRILLGIVPTAVGGAAFDISPMLADLEWAEGASDSVRGPVQVRWERTADTLTITAQGPAETTLRYVPNATHAGLRVVFNGEEFGAAGAPAK